MSADDVKDRVAVGLVLLAFLGFLAIVAFAGYAIVTRLASSFNQTTSAPSNEQTRLGNGSQPSRELKRANGVKVHAGPSDATRHSAAHGHNAPLLRISDAQIIKKAQPSYPEEARAAFAQGTVIVQLTIDPNGKLVGSKIYQSSGNQLLDAAALAAARHSTYRGPTTTHKYLIEYVFKLE